MTRMTKRGRAFLYTLLILLAAIWLLPFYAMLTTSLKTPREVTRREFLTLPHRPNFTNYIKALNSLGRGLINSTIISLPATALAVFIGSWGGYFLSMFKFKYAQYIFFATAIVTFLPYHIILIPFTQLMARLNLINTYQGLILAYVILNTPMAALITSTFFSKVPRELQEAAALDGCSPVTFYWKILLPVALIGIAATAILVFTLIWNEFLLGLTLTQGAFVKPVMPILAELKGTFVAQWHIQMAGAMLTAIPPLIIFIFLGRYFVTGLIAGTLE